MLCSSAEADPVSRWSRNWTLRALPTWGSLGGTQGGNPLGDSGHVVLGQDAWEPLFFIVSNLLPLPRILYSGHVGSCEAHFNPV